MMHVRGRHGGGLAVYALAYLAFLYAPVLLLPLFSFNDSAFIAFPLSGFTTKWYAAIVEDACAEASSEISRAFAPVEAERGGRLV